MRRFQMEDVLSLGEPCPRPELANGPPRHNLCTDLRPVGLDAPRPTPEGDDVQSCSRVTMSSLASAVVHGMPPTGSSSRSEEISPKPASASHRHHSPIGRLVLGVRATAESANPRQNGLMILEHAVLDVIPGEERHFEESFDQARSIIGSMPGFRSRRLARCIETPSRYLLLVEWDRLEDHTEGFRGSAEYEEYRRRLHHFYDPFPVFEHYQPLVHL